jgi:predicted phosphodiesterase
MTSRLRIAHCADIHLGGPLADGGLYKIAFLKMLAEMQSHLPDIMLLAGDLFDSNSTNKETVEWAMETLGRQPFPIVMIPGNHDCLEENAIFTHYDFNGIPNVTILTSPDGTVADLPDLGVRVWGKGMVEHTPAYRPLGGCPARPANCRWYLGLGHGLFVPHGGRTDRSSPIHMSEIEESPFDYIALGHHHAALEVITERAIAVYSGSPTDDIGRGATYVIADLVIGCMPSITVHVVKNGARNGGR